MTATNVERLLEIEETQLYTERDGLDYSLVRADDFNWIVDQAKRAQELENLIKTHAPEGRNYTNQQYVGLIRDFTLLEEILEFYANKDNYSIWTDSSNNCPTNNVTFDDGYRARQALEQLK